MSIWIACAGSCAVLAACARPPAPTPVPVAPRLGATAAFERAVRDGRTQFNAGDYAASVAGWQRALDANPGDDNALYWLARASLRAGEPAAAVAALRRIADAGGAVVPFADHFSELRDDAAYRAVAARLAAQAAQHRRAVWAFRLPEPGLLVEGIAYDPVGRAFYAGSGTRRKLIRIASGQAPADFVGPRPDIDSIGGLRVDPVRRRLWAVSGTDARMDGFVASDPERNALIEIDLASGAVVGNYPLTATGHHVLNDVAIDRRGRPFATDTADGQLYTLAADGASLVAVFDAPPYFRPNGIAADDSGALLFVADATGVHRFDVAAHTTQRIAQPRGSTIGQLDGLYFVRSARGARLVGIQTVGTGRVIEAALSPGLDAVIRVDVLESDHPLFDGPTTGAVVDGELYLVANSQLWAPRPPRETVILKLPIDPR